MISDAASKLTGAAAPVKAKRARGQRPELCGMAKRAAALGRCVTADQAKRVSKRNAEARKAAQRVERELLSVNHACGLWLESRGLRGVEGCRAVNFKGNGGRQ